jgi:hypothetical protein
MMASGSELVETICQIIATSPTPIPVTLMNHGVEAAAEIIGAVVERCSAQGIGLVTIQIDSELGEELGLKQGARLTHGDRPIVEFVPKLGKNVVFVATETKG